MLIEIEKVFDAFKDKDLGALDIPVIGKMDFLRLVLSEDIRKLVIYIDNHGNKI